MYPFELSLVPDTWRASLADIILIGSALGACAAIWKWGVAPIRRVLVEVGRNVEHMTQLSKEVSNLRDAVARHECADARRFVDLSTRVSTVEDVTHERFARVINLERALHELHPEYQLPPPDPEDEHGRYGRPQG